MSYPVPANEEERNSAVRSYRVMDTPPEPDFDEISDLAARICDCPVSYVSFVEGDRLSLKAKYGIPDDFQGCPREIAFCSVTICGADLIHSADLSSDDRFKEFHFVLNDPHFRFYCAMPLVTPEGYSVGTVCVMDFKPRQLSFEQQESMRRLAHQLVGLLEHRRRLIELNEAMQALDQAHRDLTAEKARSEDLLYRILPQPIAEELKANGKVEPRFFPSATVLLTDIKGFTRFTRTAEPAMLIDLLDKYFASFDDAIAERGLEKVKTIGDAYLAVAGVPEPDRWHAVRACLAALDIVGICERIRSQRDRLRLPFFEVRIGLHTGPLIAGAVGRRRFSYDIWGDAVNVASIMESHGEAGRINVSEDVYNHVRPYFELTERGPVRGKDGVELPMFFVDRLKPEFSTDDGGRQPNERLFSAPGLAAAGATSHR